MEESLLEDRMCLQRIRLTRHLTQDLLQFNDMDIESACNQNHENETVQMLNSIIEEVNNEDGKLCPFPYKVEQENCFKLVFISDSSQLSTEDSSTMLVSSGQQSISVISPQLTSLRSPRLTSLVSPDLTDLPPSYSRLMEHDNQESEVVTSPPCYQVMLHSIETISTMQQKAWV